uniref:NADH:ubiquinone oxidoreductase complex assembly factor 2 n=1 Tax=Rattus norvegicus TaxID=10116 RepID=A0A8I6G9G1_RAT
MSWWRGVVRSVWSALSREVREHVGTDHLGNKYYYVAEYKNWRGQTMREKRIVETANRTEVDYEAGDIPTEWEGKCPPPGGCSEREEIKIKSQDFYEKDKLGKETSEELLPSPTATQIKGHASAPYFGKEEPSVVPTSTGKTFQPGSWVPEDRKRQ